MANDCFYAFRTRDTEPAPWLDGSSSLHSTTHTFGCWHKLCGHLVQGSIGDPTQSLAQDMKQESPTAFQGSIRHRGTVRNHFTCLIGFRTTPLWYATSIIQPQRFRTVPQANCPSQKGGIPTILMSASRRGTVRNHSNMLNRILYHTSVVQNADSPAQKLPYRTTAQSQSPITHKPHHLGLQVGDGHGRRQGKCDHAQAASPRLAAPHAPGVTTTAQRGRRHARSRMVSANGACDSP